MDRKIEIKAIEGLLSHLNKSYRVPQLQGKSPWKEDEVKEEKKEAKTEVKKPVVKLVADPVKKESARAMSRAGRKKEGK